MLVACKKAEKETKLKIRVISKKNIKIEKNKTFIHTILSFDEGFFKKFFKKPF